MQAMMLFLPLTMGLHQVSAVVACSAHGLSCQHDGPNHLEQQPDDLITSGFAPALPAGRPVPVLPGRADPRQPARVARRASPLYSLCGNYRLPSVVMAPIIRPPRGVVKGFLLSAGSTQVNLLVPSFCTMLVAAGPLLLAPAVGWATTPAGAGCWCCSCRTHGLPCQHGGPDHLGLWCNAIPDHQMPLITSGFLCPSQWSAAAWSAGSGPRWTGEPIPARQLHQPLPFPIGMGVAPCAPCAS